MTLVSGTSICQCRKMTREELNTLIDKYLSGLASPREERIIDNFFNAQERKQTLSHYRLSEEMWASIEKKMQTRKEEFSGADPKMTTHKLRRRLSAHKVLIAVIFILTLCGIFYLQRGITPYTEDSWATSESPKGQKSLITLADGSRVFLNSASSISYPKTFETDKREILLTGEAFFEIARDEKRPLMVRSGNVTTLVLGTSFNIEAFEGEPTKITVATGKVQVEVQATSGGKDTPKVILAPNQQAVYDAKQGLVAKDVELDRFVAWKDQTLYFDNNTLEEVAAHLERWYTAANEFENERIKNCRINGQYKEMDLRSVLESIQYMYPVKYKFSNQNHIVLYGKGCDQ
jgi:transmembrane sensor